MFKKKNHHVMKTYGEAKVQFRTYLSSARIGDGQLQVPVALLQRKEPSVLIELEDGCAPTPQTL
jgi:hypothetical protein